VWCRLRMNRQDKIEGRVVVSPTQNWGATRRTEPTRRRNLRTATDASRHDFSPQFTSPGGCAEPLHLRSVLNPMVFPCRGRSSALVARRMTEDERASASSNPGAVSSLNVSQVFRRSFAWERSTLGVSARDVDESMSAKPTCTSRHFLLRGSPDRDPSCIVPGRLISPSLLFPSSPRWFNSRSYCRTS
jgi:hypothetical protein